MALQERVDLERYATMAPGGLDVYTGTAIPSWTNSILALSLLRGVVFKIAIAPDGRSTIGPPLEALKTTNRYRDIAINPDGAGSTSSPTTPAGPPTPPAHPRSASSTPGVCWSSRTTPSS